MACLANMLCIPHWPGAPLGFAHGRQHLETTESSTAASTAEAKAKKVASRYYFQDKDEKYAHYVRNDCTKEDAEAWLADDAKGTYIFRKGER